MLESKSLLPMLTSVAILDITNCEYSIIGSDCIYDAPKLHASI